MPNPASTGLPNPHSYDTSVPDVVVDQITGLMWQRTIDPNSYTYGGAAAPCAALSLAGYDDWRLPTVIELVSLVDYTVRYPAMDGTAFPATPTNEAFWASTPVVWNTTRAQSVVFGTGDTSDSFKGTPSRIRCVRDTRERQTTARYVEGNGTITDARTQLSWQRLASAPTYTREEALTYCSGLDLEGAGWRVPSMKELQTIIDFTRSAPALDTRIFPGSSNEKLWSSTLVASGMGLGTIVDFSSGATLAYDVTIELGVRCVR